MNNDTPRTNEVDQKCRKLDGEDYWPGKMRDHARQLERELAALVAKHGQSAEHPSDKLSDGGEERKP